MSDTPFPPNPFEGEPDETNPFEGGPLDDGASGAADSFFSGLDDDGFEPALDAGTFSEGADAYFAASPPEAIEEMPAQAPEAPDALIAAPAASPRRRRKTPAKSKPKGRGTGSKQVVLGLSVTPTHVHGVLLRDDSGGHFTAIRTMTRVRSQGTEDTSGAMTPADVGGPSLDGLGDETIQFGSTQELDFTGEFDGLAMPGDVGIDVPTMGQPRASAQPIIFELRDMLEELSQNGFERPALAFSLVPPDVEYAEILVSADKKKKSKKAAKETKKKETPIPTNIKREKLVAQLPPSQPGREIDTDRVAFVPMTSREGRPRFLAVIPQPTDPVVPALTMLREQSRHRRTAFKTIESEVSLLMGLSGLACPSEPHENTAVVRVGSEDTLVLLLSGGQLHHMEPMQSVTAYDGPDTICSRVLLQQDVQGVGTVHNVIVLADEREEELVQGFAAFYPDARVSTMSGLLAELGIEAQPSASPDAPAPSLSTDKVEASGAALAALIRKDSPFPDSNLLPKVLRKKKGRIDLTFGWHTLVVAVLLFLSVVFFIGLYFTQASEIADREQTLAEYPPEATMAVPQLQMRIDSLRQAQVEITTSLAALDSLLYGTDRWTQDLVRTSRAASGTGGVWFEDWQPDGANINLHGYATSRSRVVALAQRLNAVIEEVTFQDVRDFPVYEWRIVVPSPIELPQTARYLREQLGEPIPAPRNTLAGLDDAAPTGATPQAQTGPAPTMPPASAGEPGDPPGMPSPSDS